MNDGSILASGTYDEILNLKLDILNDSMDKIQNESKLIFNVYKNGFLLIFD